LFWLLALVVVVFVFVLLDVVDDEEENV